MQVSRCAQGLTWIVAMMAAVLGASRPAAGEDATISLRVQAQPDRELPAGLTVVSVEAPSYLDRQNDDGLMRTDSEAFYNILRDCIADGFKTGAPGVTLVDRKDIVNRQTEMRRSRGGDPDEDGPAAGAFAAQAQIVPRLRVEWEVKRYSKDKAFHRSVAEGFKNSLIGRGGSGPREYRERLLVRVYCDINMHFTATGVQPVSYGRMLEEVLEDEQGVWGYGQKRLAEMDGAQKVAHRLIRRHVDNFLSRILPIRPVFEVKLKDCHSDVRAAVGKLNAGDFQEAAMRTWRRWTKEKEDHQACYVAGLAYELMGQRDKAHQWYQLSFKDEPEEQHYSEAIARISGDEPMLVPAREPSMAAGKGR